MAGSSIVQKLKTFTSGLGHIIRIMALTLCASFSIASGVGAESVSPVFSQPVSASSADPAEPRVVINIPSRTLWVYEGNRIVNYFPVGVGKPGFMTPLGKFSIISKVMYPGWENPYKPKGKVRLAPGEDNPLGTRWMGFYQKGAGEYGMHGTDTPSSVGKFSSHGCVRMKIADAESLFEIVDMGTPVEVTYEPVLVRMKENRIRVIVYPDRFKRGMPTVEQVQAKILKQYPDAALNLSQIAQALAQPSEKPVDVGNLPVTSAIKPQTVVPQSQTASYPNLPKSSFNEDSR